MYQLLQTMNTNTLTAHKHTNNSKTGLTIPETTKIMDSYLKITKRISNLLLTAEWSSLGVLIKLPCNYKKVTVLTSDIIQQLEEGHQQ